MISSLGIGSGLDANSIVEQLMQIERVPLENLERDKTDLNAKLSTFGQLNSALSTFQKSTAQLKSIDSFKRYSTTSSNEDAFTVSAGSTASIGSTGIQVNNLAEVHKMGSVSFLDTDTTLLGAAGDQMTITVNAQSFTVDAGGKTLEEIRNAINTDVNNTGITATIINENDNSHYLVLTSIESGVANSMNLSFTGSLAADFGFTQIQAAEDSQILVDGLYTVTRSGNVITDAIDGLSISLLNTTTQPEELTVSRNIDGVTESVQAFVDAYNELNTALDTFSQGDLGRDGTIRAVESRIRGVLDTDPAGLSGVYNHLTDVGISVQRDGTMTLSKTDLKEAVNTDFSSFSELFANDDQGYLFRLNASVDKLLDIDGLLDGRKSSISSRLGSLDRQIERQDYLLGLTELRLRSQFSALDTLMGDLGATSQYLNNQLAALPTFQK